MKTVSMIENVSISHNVVKDYICFSLEESKEVIMIIVQCPVTSRNDLRGPL